MRTFPLFPFIWLSRLSRYIFLAPVCPQPASGGRTEGAPRAMQWHLPLVFLALLCCVALLLPSTARAQATTTPTLDPFNFQVNGSVRAFVQNGDKLWIGGWFSYVGGSLALRLARFNGDGTRDTSIAVPQPNDWVHALARSGEHIYVGGDFSHVNGVPRPYIFRFKAATGELDTSFQPLAGTTANTLIGIKELLVQPDGKVVIAGSFLGNGGAHAVPNYIARLNPDGTLDTSFTPPNLNNDVWAIALQGNRLLVGGYFTNVNVGGTPRHRLIRLNADGTVDPTFSDPGLSSSGVFHLSIGSDGKINVGGAFNGPRKYLVRLTADGALDTSFQDPGIVGGYVADMVPHPDGGWLIGGSFSSVGGQPRADLARLHADGTLDTSFGNLLIAPNQFNEREVWRLSLLPNRRLAIGGHFSSVLGQPRSHAAMLRLPGFTVTASFNGGNGAATPATQDVGPGQSATIALAPAAGYAVDAAGTTSTCGAGSLDAGGTTYTVDAVTADCTVTFRFAPLSHAIATTANPVAGGGVTCTPNPVPHGGSTTCTATAHAGYNFAGFNGDCAGMTCQLTGVTAPKNVTASFSPVLRTFNGPIVPAAGQPGGMGSASVTGGGPGCAFDTTATSFVPPPASPPEGLALPQGMLHFRLTGCDSSEVTVSVTWPHPVAGVIKHGRASSTATTDGYYRHPGASHGVYTTSIKLKDNELGDADPAQGSIVDPLGPIGMSTASLIPVPTLREWGLVLLSLGVVGLSAQRPRRGA